MKRKKILATLMAFALILSLGACSTEAKDDPERIEIGKPAVTTTTKGDVAVSPTTINPSPLAENETSTATATLNTEGNEETGIPNDTIKPGTTQTDATDDDDNNTEILGTIEYPIYPGTNDDFIFIEVIDAEFTRDLSKIDPTRLKGNGEFETIEAIPDDQVMLLITMKMTLNSKEPYVFYGSAMNCGSNIDISPEGENLRVGSYKYLKYFSGHPSDKLYNGKNYLTMVLNPLEIITESVAFIFPLDFVELEEGESFYFHIMGIDSLPPDYELFPLYEVLIPTTTLDELLGLEANAND